MEAQEKLVQYRARSANFPSELTGQKIWANWKWIQKDGSETKIPIQPFNGRAAASNDPSTWSSFESCVSYYEKFAGLRDWRLGIFFPEPSGRHLIGIDLDSCIQPGGNQVAPWAEEIIDQFSTYTEISPSGNGLKMIGFTNAKWSQRNNIKIDADHTGAKKPGIEVYDSRRFWTVTGQVVGSNQIADCDDALKWLVSRYEALKRPEPPARENCSPVDVIRFAGSHTKLLERASKLLAKKPPAVSGQGGSNRLYEAFACLIKGLELSSDDAYRLIVNEYNPRCIPHWSEKDLRHKMEAVINAPGETGYLLKGLPSHQVQPVVSWKSSSEESKPQTSSEIDSLYDLSIDSGRTDQANAVRFVTESHKQLLYVPEWKKWLNWDGKRWNDDSEIGVYQLAKSYSEKLWHMLPKFGANVDDSELLKIVHYMKSCNQRNKIRDFIELASSDSRVVCRVNQLNQNPLALNVQNGTVDLSTGELRPHSQADRITQIANTSFDPSAKCEQWLKTLDLIFASDAELIRFVQQVLGYAIAGDCGEHILPIAWGNGSNGKSTIWGTVAELLGDYSWLASEDLLLGDSSSHPTAIASLYQKRFVPISEPAQNAKLREARVKELTGDRTITARRMGENFWSFQRSHTFWLSTNHLPQIDGRDEGIWRRVKLIPFRVDLRNIVKPIANYESRLVADEGPGILAWLVRGFLDWQQNGFVEPEAVIEASKGYRDESDTLTQFLDECCVIRDDAETPITDVWRAYEAWGGKLTKIQFGKSISERFKKQKSKTIRNRDKYIYLGLAMAEFSRDEYERTARQGAFDEWA